MAQILVVEDQADIAASIGEFLELHGHVIDYAADGLTASNLATRNNYDLFIFDIGLPGMDGISLCQLLRKHLVKMTPVLFLTARDRLDDKLAGFDAGGDDYLVKPFQLAELLARIKALLKRSYNQQTRLIEIDELQIDTAKCLVYRAGLELNLTPMCYQILLLLAKHAPDVVSRQCIEAEVWQDTAPDSDALRSHLYLLRQKLDKPFDYPLIQTVAKRGFKLCR